MPTSARSIGFRGVFRDDDLAACAVYSEAAGIAQIIPRAVAVPEDADDLVTLVQWAAQYGVPLVPRGSGSSMAGGAIGDGVIVDLSGLSALHTVDVERRTVRCEPGVLRDAVDAAARAVGLSFPVDPSSGAYCTVGGMASTNSAGAHTLALRRDASMGPGARLRLRRRLARRSPSRCTAARRRAGPPLSRRSRWSRRG